MSSGKHELESISVRRAQVVDADKVRYRVYTSPSEFIAVIAESALMAVRVSGVKTPHKIMRDLPTDGIAIEARKMAEIAQNPERVSFKLNNDPQPAQRLTEMEDLANRPVQPFVPVGLADLRAKSGNRARILPPEMVNQIIEDHAKAQAPKAEEEVVEEPAPLIEEEHETILIPEPELSAAEKITMMANDILPSAAEAAPIAAVESDENVLSPEEVESLLNGQ